MDIAEPVFCLLSSRCVIGQGEGRKEPWTKDLRELVGNMPVAVLSGRGEQGGHVRAGLEEREHNVAVSLCAVFAFRATGCIYCKRHLLWWMSKTTPAFGCG